MLVNPNAELNSPQILKLITQFYCSLSARKDMQNISAEIRQFVMKTNIIKKEQTAKRILDFFLRIQSRLVSKSDKNWDQAFEIATARGYALIKICQFPVRNSILYAMNRLKAPAKLTKRESDTIVLEIESQSQEVNIQIQMDVKTKTYYFFKWCQYLEHSKALKQMKQRQVQNQKLSLSFNKYGTKSNCFNAWKILYKKCKAEKQKIKQIESRVNQNMLKQKIAILSQVAAIITIQSTLSKKVGQKIQQIKKKGLIKKLKLNQSFIRKQAKSRKYSNKFAYIFLNHFSEKIKPLMNRSFQINRSKLESDVENHLLRKYFQLHKKLTEESTAKLQQIVSYRKLTFLKYWKSDCEEAVSFLDKSQKFENYLSIRRKRTVVTILSFNKLLREEQFNKIQTLIQSNGYSINNQSVKKANRKKEMENKKNDLIESRNIKQQMRFLVQLQNHHRSLSRQVSLSNKLKKLSIGRLRLRYRSYMNRLAKSYDFQEKLTKKHERTVQIQAFKNWRRLKYVKRLQQSSIQSINKCSTNLILRNFWTKLRFRAFERNCVETLINASQAIIFKLAYFKLAARSIFINANVKRIQNNGNKKATKKLFQLLVKNSSFNSERASELHKVTAKRYQILLINKLKNLHFSNQKCEKLKQKRQKSRIVQLFCQLSIKSQIQKDIDLKYIKASKKIFLKYLKKTTKSSKSIQQEIENKNEEICEYLRQISIRKLIDKLKYRKRQKEIEREKQSKVIFKIASRKIIAIKQFIHQEKETKKIMRNKKLLRNKRKQEAFHIIAIKQKVITTQSETRRSKMKIGFKDFIQLCKQRIKGKTCLEQLKDYKETKDICDFFKVVAAEKKRTEAKIEKVDQLQINSLENKKKVFFSHLRANKENIHSQLKLSQIRKHALFSEFVATNLRCKFSRIKFNCSLKTYARNIMKKALRSLKEAQKRGKQKENMLRLDKTSSIMAQKSIEKSFKSNTLSEQIGRFNLRKSRHQIR